jgi:hypothetical protein
MCQGDKLTVLQGEVQKRKRLSCFLHFFLMCTMVASVVTINIGKIIQAGNSGIVGEGLGGGEGDVDCDGVGEGEGVGCGVVDKLSGDISG